MGWGQPPGPGGLCTHRVGQARDVPVSHGVSLATRSTAGEAPGLGPLSRHSGPRGAGRDGARARLSEATLQEDPLGLVWGTRADAGCACCTIFQWSVEQWAW